jgi:regulator of replication initiation timing
MKKVTDQELEKLQQFVNTINEAQATIGGLETQKHALVTETEGLITELKAMQAELEKEYGNVTVNLTTGEITDADNPQD